MKACILLITFLIFSFISVSSQIDLSSNFIVKGQIKDSVTNEVIPYATIKIKNKVNPDKVLQIFVTDENGNYTFNLNQKRDYFITVNFIGKKTMVKPIQARSAETMDMGVIYLQDEDKHLSEVVVSVRKQLVKVDLDKIIYNMEDDPESETSNVLEMLRKVPLLSLDGDENLQIKGSSNYKIYLNGKPSNMIMSNPKDVLRSMPANSIKEIEVIADPGVKYDSEGITGIINVVMKRNSLLTGYTATLNGRANDFGGFGSGVFLQLKYGKVGFTGGYNYNQNKTPKGNTNSFTEDYNNSLNRYQKQNGFSKTNRNGQSMNGEISIEVDSLSLLSLGINRYKGNAKSDFKRTTEMQSIDYTTQYIYDLDNYSRQKDGATDINLDYQRSFNKKNQLLTVSYRFSLNPNNRKSENLITPVIGILPESAETNKQFTDAKMKEHTIQSDFTTPFGKAHSIETGVKYIMRSNKSNSGYDLIDNNEEWVNKPRLYDDFKYEQNILAAYAGYSAKLKKWGIKTGLRYERTSLQAKFPKAENKNFENEYSNLMPSATIAYQIKPTQNIRLGYNMRVQRPGIYQLNPYEDTSNPNNIRIGNSELDAVQNHKLNINYSFFTQSVNFITNLSYDVENNGIVEITTRENGISKTTFENIGKKKDLALSAYANWVPNKKITMYSNVDGRYIDLKSDFNSESAIRIKNSGFVGNIVIGGEYTFPYNFRAYINGGYSSRQISLQGKGSSYFFHSMSVTKVILKNRLQIRAYAQNPLEKNKKFRNSINTNDFYSESKNTYKVRQFGISVSFRFGEMKTKIKKVQKTIINDDIIKASKNNDEDQIENQTK